MSDRAPRQVQVTLMEDDLESINLTVTQNNIISTEVKGLRDVVGTLEAILTGLKGDLRRKETAEKLGAAKIYKCVVYDFTTNYEDVARSHVKMH